MKNNPVGRLPLKQNPFKRLPIAQPANFVAPSFDNNSGEPNQDLLENTPPQTNLPEKPSSEERTNEQHTFSQVLFPEREDQSNEYSGIEIGKAFQGTPQSSSESDKAPKKNKMQPLPPIHKTLKFQQTEEEVSPSRDSGFTPLMRSPDTERETDKSPASASPLISQKGNSSKTPKNEAKSGKKDSAFKRAVTGMTGVARVTGVTGATGVTRVTPEQEIELVQTDKKTKSKTSLLKFMSSTAAGKQLKKLTNTIKGGAIAFKDGAIAVKDGAMNLMGMRQDSETPNDDEDDAGDDVVDENDEGNSLLAGKTQSVRRFGGVLKGKTNQPRKPKKFFGLTFQEKKSQNEKAKTDLNKSPLSKKNRRKILLAVWKRRVARFILLAIYMVIIIVAVAIAFINLIDEGHYSSFTNTALSFTLDNCTLQILDHDDTSISSPVYFKYQVPKELTGSPQIDIFEPDSSGVNYRIDVQNKFDVSYCRLGLFIKAGTPLDSLSFSCGTCHIIQATSFQLQVTGNVNIYGDREANANFRDIKVNTFNYNTTTGYLQLSNIEASSDSNVIDLLGEGDIIIQSVKEFQVNITTNTEAFCLNGPFVDAVGTGTCALTGGANTTFDTQDTCQVIYNLSPSASSSPTTKYTITSKYSNVYANIIPGVGIPVTGWGDIPLIAGRKYDDGIAFSKTAGDSVSNFDNLIADSSKGNPFIILDIGNFNSRSARYMRWVLSSTPSYSLMRPWWIATVSATILNGYTEKVSGYLLPGICPYTPQYTVQNHYQVNTLLTSLITSPNTLFTFVKDNGLDRPPIVPQATSGIFNYSQSRNPFDEWLSISITSNISVTLEENSYSDKPTILASVVASVIIAILIAYLLLLLVMSSVNLMYTKLINFTSHLQSYARLENRNEDQDPEENVVPRKQSKNSFKRFLSDSPSPVAFLDYIMMILYRQYASSVTQFYRSLFRAIDPSEDQELDPNRDMLKGTEAKILYEKFCFLKNLSEQRLTDKKNLEILKSYGFEIITRSDVPCEVFTKIKIENRENFLSSTLLEEKVDSLKIYMDENIERTEFDEDQVEVEDFIQSYYRFCDHNRFPRVIVYPSLMKERFDINHAIIPQQYITRKQHEDDDDDWIPTKTLGLDKLGIDKLLKPAININAKYYIIDTVRLKNNLALVMDKVSDMTESELSEATLDLILFKGHWVWDAFSVLIHLIGTALVPVPVIMFVMLSDSQYEPWSVKEPYKLVWFNDILRDPATLVKNVFLNFTWNTVIMIIMSALTILSFVELVLSYFVMEFPQDKTFRKSHLKSENSIQKFSRKVQWGFVLLMLFFYFTYIGLLLTWLLLGAFINPNAFLPFASSALTFATFFLVKYKAFKELTKQGADVLMKHLKAFLDESMKKVMGKLAEGAEKAASSVIDKGKGLLESETFNHATNQLVDIGIIDQDMVEEYKKKIQDLDNQAIIEGGIAVAKDRNVLLNKMNEVTNSLKEKAVERVKEECRNRKVPEPIMDLVIGLYIKNNEQVRKGIADIIQIVVKEQKMPEETVEIILDLLFPRGGDKYTMVRSTGSKIVKMIFKKLELEEKIKGFNPQTLLNALMNFQNLEEFNYESFLYGLQQLTRDTNYYGVISALGPALKLISVLSEEKPKYWKAKEPALELLKSSVGLLTENQKDIHGFSPNTFDSFADFISLLSASYGEQSLEPQYMLRVISNFCSSTGISKVFHDKTQISGEFIPSLIYLILSYAQPETYKLSKEAIQNLAEAFNLGELGNNNFLPFCFELASTIYYNAEQSGDRITKCIANFDLNPKLGDFIKIVAFYSMEDDGFHDHPKGAESHDHHKGVDHDWCFIRMSEKVEMQPQELLGLIDLLYGKHNNQSTRSFLEAIMKRMDIKREKLKKLEPVINLFMSDDESVVLNAMKALNLAHKRILLIGKGILNPKFVPVKKFEEIGVQKDAQIIIDKDTVYDPDNENTKWLNWKNGIIPKGSSTEGTKDSSTNNQQEQLSFYMNGWDHFVYSPKSIDNFLTLIDPEKTLVDSDKGSMINYINFLSVVLPLKTLRLKKNTRYKQLSKDQEAVIKKIADCLNIRLDPLKTCLQMFIVKDQDVISNGFSFFFQDKFTDDGALDRALSYSFKQMSIMNDKIEFLTKKLPKAISLMDNNLTSFLGSIIKNIFFGGSKQSLRTRDILELSSFIISKFNKDETEQDHLLEICYKVILFSKSLLTIKDIKEFFHIEDKGIENLFEILTELDPDTRIARIIDIFPDDTNPLKFSMALYAVLTGHNPMVKKTPTVGLLIRNKPASKKESLKNYLSEMFKVEPEFFDLFEIVFERNPTLFIQKAMPLLRRVTKTSLIDTNLMESLLSLSLGHRFNTSYLSNRLRIPSDTLDFFISLLRLSNKQTRKEELAILSKSTAAKHVLKKLGIELPELVALIRLVFNMFDDEGRDKEKLLLKTITDLGFKTVESSTSADNETVEMERFEGFMTLSLPIDPTLKDKKRIANLKTLKNQTTGFFSAFSLTPDDAFLISRITIGDFLAIRQYPERLEWAFPLQDQSAASAIMNLTMGICGLVNPHVTTNLHKQVSGEPNQKSSQDSLPNNTLGYATYLTYSTLEIAPFWTQAFMFDKEAYSKLENNAPEIKPDFVITIVTNFIDMSEAARDILAFYEWNKAYRNFMDANNLEHSNFVTDIEEYVWRFFAHRFIFDYNEIKSRVKQSKTPFGNLGKNSSKAQERYNSNINKTLWALFPSLQSTIGDHLNKQPSEFLSEIAKSYKGESNVLNDDQERLAVGEVVKLAIEECYSRLVADLPAKEKPIEGYKLTDLCMLGTIVNLRDSEGQKMPYERQLYNLHQLTMNIERKLFLEDQYYKMSKFKLMKLVGISLGMQVSNIVEWCLPPSLFTSEYVTKLEKAEKAKKLEERQRQRLDTRVNLCKKLDRERDIKVGDLGKCGGSSSDYINLLESMLETNEWESINALLALSEKYLGDPNADANKSEQQINKVMNAKNFKKCKVSHSKETLYLPLEFVEQKPEPENPDDAQSNEKETKKTETLKDAKTSLPYSVLEQRYTDFERTLTHANMGLIQGVINGDPSVMLRGNHDIVRNDREKKTKAKLYMALIGLQVFRDRSDRKRLEEYLHPISQKMQSEKSKIRSLLLFFTSGNPDLKEIISGLDLDQGVVDLLFVSLKKQTHNIDDNVEEASVFSSFQTLLKASEREIEAFQLIKNIYEFDLYGGWLPLIELLSKVELKDEKSICGHALALLFEMINFDKLKNPSTTLSGQGLLSFLKSPSEILGTSKIIGASKIADISEIVGTPKIAGTPKIGDTSEFADTSKIMGTSEIAGTSEIEGTSKIAGTILKICNIVCGDHKLLSKIDEKVFQALESIVKQDFSQLFKMLILSNNNKKSGDSPTKSTIGKLFAAKIYEPESLLEKLLDLIGINIRSPQAIKDMKIVRMFLTMANGDFKAIKNSPDYNMNSIINTILESQLFASFAIDESMKRSLTQLLLGALSWDLEIIMGGLINPNTLKEAYFIYNLFGCLNLNKIYQLTSGKNKGAHIKKHVEVVLSAIIENVAPKCEIPDLSTIEGLINEDLGSVSPEMQCEDLKKRMGSMLKMVQNINKANIQTTSFLQSVANMLKGAAQNARSSLTQVFSTSGEDPEKDLYGSLVGILTSVCDGTLLKELINGFIKDENLKKVINELIQFIVTLVLTLQEKKAEHKEKKTAHTEEKALFTHFTALIQAINNLKPHKAWDLILKVVPEFMRLYVNLQGGPKLDQIIKEILETVQHLLTVMESEKQALLMESEQQDPQAGSEQQASLMSLMGDVFSLVVGADLNDFKDFTTTELIPKFNTSVGEKTHIIFTKIMPKVFPSLEKYITGDQLDCIYKIIVKLQTDFVENIRNPTKLHDLAYDVAQLLESFGYCNADFIDDIRGVLRGRISYIYYLLGKLMPDVPSEIREEVRGYLLQCESLFNAIPINRSLQLDFKSNDAGSKKANQRDWGALLQRIKEGTTNGLAKELFQLVDQEGDGSGKISVEEFSALASRIGLKLSQHRIIEIFAKVKKGRVSKEGNQELDEKEFEKALNYLEEKNLYQAMEMLGITPENLGVIFVILILLLLLIFIFIFLGIKAFTIGGTFGAIINSAFPAIGGLSLAKKSDSSKEKLEDEHVENAAETAYNINTSADI